MLEESHARAAVSSASQCSETSRPRYEGEGSSTAIQADVVITCYIDAVPIARGEIIPTKGLTNIAAMLNFELKTWN